MNSTQFFWFMFIAFFGSISLMAFIEYIISKIKQHRRIRRYMALKRSAYNRNATIDTFLHEVS